MAGWALGLMVFYLALAFGVRVGVALRTTGKTGISSVGSAPAIELVGGGLFFTGVLLGGINPALALADTIPVWDELDTTAAHVAGFAFCAVGIVGTFAAQMAMGSSWRIGVDPDERTELVTGGIFGFCRNPIYTFMLVAWVGFALLVPTWVALAAGVLLISGIQIQVRLAHDPDPRGDLPRLGPPRRPLHSGPWEAFEAARPRFRTILGDRLASPLPRLHSHLGTHGVRMAGVCTRWVPHSCVHLGNARVETDPTRRKVG